MRHPIRLIVVVGVALCCLSAFMPWVEARVLSEEYKFAPATTTFIAAAVLFDLVLMVGGTIWFVLRSNVALVGAAGAIWFNLTIVVWLAGFRIVSLVPSDLLPEGAAAQLGLGASVGAAGGVLVMVGCVLALTEATFGWTPSVARWWTVPAAIGVAVLVLIVRDLPWVNVTTTRGFDWELSFDVVPFVGDVLVVLLVAAAVTVLILALAPQRLLAWAVVVIGALIAFIGATGFLARGSVTRVSDWLVDQASFLDGVEPSVSATAAPLGVALVGVAVSATGWWLGRSCDSRLRLAGSQMGELPGPLTDQPSAVDDPPQGLPF